MKYSLSTFVYYRYTLKDTLKRIKALGYDGVEIWGGRPHAYHEDITDDRIEEIRALLDELDLEISNFIPAQFRYPTNLASTDELIRNNSVNYIKHNVDVAEKLSSPYVSICPGYSMYGDKPNEAMAALEKSISEIIEYAKNYKTMIIIEPAHYMETDLIMTVKDAVNLIEKFGKDRLGLCVDTGHLHVNKESFDTYDLTKDYIVHYHIDDNFGISDDHLVPGEGSIDFVTFLESLKNNMYRGYLAVELGFGYTTDPEAASKRSLKFLKEYA